jgi:hypothetical protein
LPASLRQPSLGRARNYRCEFHLATEAVTMRLPSAGSWCETWVGHESITEAPDSQEMFGL